MEIEELVVTAERREQSLQDVPVAVSAFTDERRDLIGINSVQDLTNFTPGLAYSTNNDRIAMRGIGRFTNNSSSEGGVAMYNDGFFTSSVTQFAQSSLFIDRTEALRGPQGTLYGKNAIGGALNIITKHPTDDPYAEVRAGIGNYDTKFLEGAVSGPLVGNIRGRLGASYSNNGKGTFKNLNPNGEDEGNRGTFWNVEGQLDGNLGDGKLEWWARAQTIEWHTLGRGPGGRTGTEYGLRDVTSPNVGALTPNSAFGLDPNKPGNTCQLCFDSDDGNYINLESQTFQFNATLHADSFDVKYIGGYTYYDYRLQTDVDQTSRQAPFLLPIQRRNPLSPALAVIPGQTANVPIFPRQNNQYEEEVWWFSNELNFTSTSDGPVQWLLGLYQFRQGSNYTNFDARYPDDARFETPTSQSGAAMAGNPLRRYAYGSSANTSESYAAFGQVDWQATDQLKFTVGLRYTYDSKTSFESARLLCIYTASCPITQFTNKPVDITDAAAPGTTGGLSDVSQVGAIYTDPTTGYRHRALKNNWDAVTGTLGADWKVNEDTLVYAKYTRGYKAGGFNSGQSSMPTFVTTDKETIDAFELGAKATLQRTLQVNASAFYYDYTDIQVPISALNPDLNQNVTQFFNMPKARILGLELEAIWQPIDNLQILANYSYLNAELRDACCFSDPDDPLGLQPGIKKGPNQSGTTVLQDLKGNPMPSSTPHRVTVNANYTWNLEPGNLTASLSYVWRDATYYAIFTDYWNKAKSFGQTDYRMIFNDKDDRYTVIGYVKNVFDTRGSAGVSGSRITTGPNTGFVNQTVSYVLPRTYGLELQYRF